MRLRLNLTRIGLVLVILLGGLHTAGAFYDPGSQRWLNRDPINEEGGLDLYSFVLNEPLDLQDPYGQCFLLQIPPIIAEPIDEIQPRLMLPPPRPNIPPSGLDPNPFRPGSWGRIGADGKYQEVWRLDKGKPGAPGWRGIDHLHFNGEKPHLPLDTPFSMNADGTLGSVNAVPTTVTSPGIGAQRESTPQNKPAAVPSSQLLQYCGET